MELFATEGLSVPLDEVARRAGVGAGTVHRHFPTKEALFAAVVVDQVAHSGTGYAPLTVARARMRGSAAAERIAYNPPRLSRRPRRGRR